MLLTRRLERARLRPLGFVANEYALAVWGLRRSGELRSTRGELSLAALFDQDMLGDDLEAWLAESALMKRTFRNCAIIAGLIERRFPGEEKTRRQMTISTDLVYDVLRKHQPDHVLLRAARADAATGLLDIRRLGDMLSRIKGRIIHKALDHVSPLAVPVMLEIGREMVYGEASDALLAEAEAELVKEAMGERSAHWSQADSIAEGSAPARGSGRDASTSPASRSTPIAPARSIGRRKTCSRRRPASRKRLELRPARHAAAALRHRRDAGAARAADRALRAAHA